MSKFLATGLSGILAVIGAHAPSAPALDAIQGVWWSNCQDPAAAFVISGDQYSGDFLGSHKLELSGDVLEFKSGLVEGHSIHVTHVPLSFRVLSVGPTELVLRPLPGNPYGKDWRLHACSSMPPNSSFKPKPLRGSA